jgi:excisionase family DNA binding protein
LAAHRAGDRTNPEFTKHFKRFGLSPQATLATSPSAPRAQEVEPKSVPAEMAVRMSEMAQPDSMPGQGQISNAVTAQAPGCRPPAYLSCASLARELDCSKSTVHELVRRGVLPHPMRFSGGTVRWRWADVETALHSLNREMEPYACDPFVEGLKNVSTKK